MLRNLSIKKRLLVNTLVVAIAMLVMLLLLVYQNQQLTHLSYLKIDAVTLEADVLQLRRHEKDFLARKDPTYLDKFNQSFSTMNEHAQSLRTHLDKFDIDVSSLDTFLEQTALYQRQFDALVKDQTRVGLDP